MPAAKEPLEDGFDYSSCTNQVALNACNGANRNIYEARQATGIVFIEVSSAELNTGTSLSICVATYGAP
jgi:hypothetical protein